MIEIAHPIVLFDGVCDLCNSSVNFIIDRDPRGVFRFASLQSPVGQDLLDQHGYTGPALDTIVLIDRNRLYTRSSAAIFIARRLNGLWPLLATFWVVPAFMRNAVYDFIARRRYRWFGKSEQCRLPRPELRDRFLDVNS